VLRGLQSKFSTGAVGLLIVVVLGMTSLWVIERRASALQESVEELSRISTMLDRFAARSIQSIDLATIDVVRRVGREGSLDSWRGEAGHQKLKSYASAAPQIRTMIIFDSQGRMVSRSSDRPIDARISIASRTYFKEMKKARRAGLGIDGPFQNRSDNRWSLGLFRSILGQQGQFLGLAYARWEPGFFADSFKGARSWPHEDIKLLNLDGVVILTDPPNEEAIGKVHAGLTEGRTLPVGIFEFPNGIERIIARRQVSGFPFVIVVSRSVEGALASWRQQAEIAGIVALLTVLLIAMAWWRHCSVLVLNRKLHSTITDLEQMEKARHSSEEDYALAVRGAYGGIWDWNITPGEVYFSPRWKAILGYENDELEPHFDPFSEFLHPDDRVLNMEAVRDHLEKRVPYNLEVRMRRKEGDYNWVRAMGQAVWDKDGKPLRMAGSISDITKRKLANKALQESEERYRDLIEGAVLPIHIRSNTGERLYVNSAFLDLFGFRSAEEFLAIEHVSTLAAPHEKERLTRYRMARIRGEDAPSDYEFDAQRKDGSYFPIRVFIRNLQWTGQDAIQLTLVDLTDRRAAERVLQESEARLAGIMQNAADGIITIDAEGIIESFNTVAEKTFGYAAEEAMGQNVRILMPEPDSSRHDGYIQSYLRTGQGKILGVGPREVTGRRKNGSTFPMDLSIGKMMIGEKQLFIGIVRDITERKRTEKALLESEEKLRKAFENTGIGMSIRNTRDRTIICNDAVCKMLGYSQEELETLYLYDITHPDDRNENQRLRGKVITGEIDGYEFTKRYIRKDGKAIWVTNDVSSIRDDQDNLLFTINLHFDLTETRKAEEQLRQAQKMEAVGQLTGGVAHDFNNLLGAIIGNLQLTENLVDGDEKAAQLIKQATDAAWRAAALTQRLLAFSRKQTLLPQVFDANKLLLRMSDLLRRTIEESIDISFVHEDELWRCEADPAQLESALLNLVINARDAMPASGKLTIETGNVSLGDEYAAVQTEATPGEYVMITVGDTGTGVPHQIIDQVFDPFFTTKEVGQGSGLGLSMVYGFVTQSGGHVTINSEEGVGTTVRLYLPRSDKAAVDLEQADPEQIPLAQGATVLVVEDDADMRTLSVAFLRSLGYEVLVAENGKSALEELERSEGINLLFTDVILPGGMNGADLAAEVRRRQPEIAVLFTSGYSREALIDKGQLDEAIELLKKPFRKADLAQKVKLVLDKVNA
jgi:PAS domain S-box-containing protein